MILLIKSNLNLHRIICTKFAYISKKIYISISISKIRKNKDNSSAPTRLLFQVSSQGFFCQNLDFADKSEYWNHVDCEAHCLKNVVLSLVFLVETGNLLSKPKNV